MNAEQAATMLFFALSYTALLARFIPPRPGQTRRRRAATLALCFAAQFAVRFLDNTEGWTAYLVMAVVAGSGSLAMKTRGGLDGKTAVQRGLCFFLLTDCVTTIACHVSQKAAGVDIFRAGPLARQALAVAGLTVGEGALLAGLKRFFPPEAQVDANSLALSLLASVPYLFARQITFWLPIARERVPVSLILTMAASCFIALTLILSLESRLFAEKEKRQAQAQQHAMAMQQQQYAARQSAIEAVRRQYHDMKNLLLYMENATSRENVRAHVSKILSDIRPFETVLDTGNDAADILLGEKLALCQKRNIPCTVIVDGAMLGFMDPLDLATVLGNAMDNAIEASARIPPAERYIRVWTEQTAGFAALRFENRCDTRTVSDGGRMETRKTDRENHGFGLLNIRSVAQKYGGEANWRAKDGEFALTLLFPK